ncbi:FAD-dependent oxidoreductase [Phytohabitans sp. ZYX-F-186]|uniref:FAD-dependent oxidoreductase n=1 Tax=Phytohabitans maris TaxID=3071409 RepID=A0ABU0ZSB1_9ACTN|nr:FAD-dependent oxidoreductase [Phytohabitans sp. ZYX-F-186]MDQ7909918.1 FAD-dependent oxidoreductase [Phytohabitans sp. ZYX-F-186]
MTSAKRGAEFDVVVIGFGAAGAAAAIVAHDAGARVAVIERGDVGGGHTRESGGSLRKIDDAVAATAYFEALAGAGELLPLYRSFAEEANGCLAWLADLGAQLVEVHGEWIAGYPRALRRLYPGAPLPAGIGPRVQVAPASGQTAAEALWTVLESAVRSRDITVRYRTPARRLLVDPGSGRVDGVRVANRAGRTSVLRARYGVVLACGGWAGDPGLLQDYIGTTLPMLSSVSSNVGDGIRMGESVGAAFRHMSALAVVLGYRLEDGQHALQHVMRAPGFVYVDRTGERFVDETGIDFHLLPLAFMQFDHARATYPHLPAYVVFDDVTRRAGPIVNLALRATQRCGWSEDNSSEVRSGVISSAPTVPDLAAALGLPGQRLAETVEAYNAAVRSGSDPFGRSAEHMAPIETPPYYGIRVEPALVNTQGGPVRDELGRVLRPSGEPVPGLFSAGELGSMWATLYPGAGNLTEALTTGRIAGRSATTGVPVAASGSTKGAP